MQEARVTGRKLRDHSNHNINYMLVTLGIEKDDDSDDDFVVDDREEDHEEEEDRFLSESDTETTQNPASQQRKQQKQKRKVESLSKPTRTIDTQGNQKRTTDKQQDGPFPKQRKLETLFEPSYEPLIDEGYRSAMETVWVGIPKKQNDESSEEREGLRGFVLRWHEASIVGRKLIFDPIEWVETPQQPDGASCGVLVVAQAHNYLTENVEQQNYGVSSHDIKVMRLRMLWVIMNLSKENTVTSSDALKTKEIQQKLEDELK